MEEEGRVRDRRYTGGGEAEAISISTKPWMKWSDSLQSLLGDPIGSDLFEKYLQQEGVSSQLDFIYAVEGLKSTASEDEPITLSQKIRSILHLSQILIGLSTSTREYLNAFYSESTKHLIADVTIFDNTVQEVESHMRTNLYPNFLKSDIYINYIADYTSANTSSTAQVALQTVQEDSELVVKKHGLTRKALQKRDWWKDEHHLRNESISNFGSGGVANPYHAGYSPFVPVSRQDSEIQSMSSGANTEHRYSTENKPSHSFQKMSNSRGRQANSGSKQHRQVQQIDNLQEIVQSSHRRPDLSHLNKGDDIRIRPERGGRATGSGSGHKQQIETLQQVIQCRAEIPHVNKGEDAEKHPEEFAKILIAKLSIITDLEARGIERFPKRISDLAPQFGHSAMSSDPPQQQLQPHVIFDAIYRRIKSEEQAPENILEEHFSRVFPDKTPDGRPSPPHQLNKSPPPFGKSKHSHGSRRQAHHIKKAEDIETGAFAGHQSRTPGYEDVLGSSGSIGGVPLTRFNRRQQRSDIVDSGISVQSSNVTAFSRVATRGSAVPVPGDPNWRHGRGGNGNGNGSSAGKVLSAIIIYEDDPKGVPYGLKLPSSKVTLGILKEHLPRRGPFRYFFKRHSSDVEGSIIHEEITRDDQTLPLFEGKLVATLKCT